jgi:hypothetical protein
MAFFASLAAFAVKDFDRKARKVRKATGSRDSEAAPLLKAFLPSPLLTRLFTIDRTAATQGGC